MDAQINSMALFAQLFAGQKQEQRFEIRAAQAGFRNLAASVRQGLEHRGQVL